MNRGAPVPEGGGSPAAVPGARDGGAASGPALPDRLTLAVERVADAGERGAAALERIAAQLERDEIRAAARALVELVQTDGKPTRRLLRIIRAAN